MPSASGKRFRITANQVTVARLIPMPLISWWAYHYPTPRYLWLAIIVGTVIGCTDFVDGYMARRQGPTVLGGLLDPIADKVFVAFCYMPFADMGVVPAWALALMFVREFLVTALRSAYERRNLTLKTSYIAKAKTWAQMQGIGVMMLFPLIGGKPVMAWILGAGIAMPLIAMAALWFIRKKFWPGALIMSASFVALFAINRHGDLKFSMGAIMVGVVAITWISAFDYFAVGFKQLRGRGDLDRHDAVRMVTAIALPCLLFAVMMRTSTAAWPLYAIMALELAVGGLDNLLSHHNAASGAGPWGLRTLSVCAVLAICLLLPGGAAVSATTLVSIAAAISFIGVAWEAWRGRDYYLDARLREKAIRVATPPPA